MASGFPHIRTCRFPAGKGTGLGEPDGITDAVADSLFVPAGLTLWELSTDENPGRKAEADYGTRKSSPPDIDRANITYVAVTARSWEKCERWALKHDKDGIWKRVVAIDAHGLAAWLEATPAVHNWFSGRLGAIPTNAFAVDMWWREWRAHTLPPISASMLLAGRENHARELRRTLRNPGGQIVTVAAETLEDGLAFVVAALTPQQVDDTDGWADDLYASRALVLEDPGAFREASRSHVPTILVPTFDASQNAGPPKDGGHSVVLPLAKDSNIETPSLTIPALDAAGIESELLSLGLDRERVSGAVKSCGEGIEALRRYLAAVRSPMGPDWARPPLGAQLALLMLAGNWDDSRQGDLAVLSAMTERDVPGLRELLSAARYLPGSPFRKVGAIWELRAPLDAWMNLSRYLDNQQLKVLLRITTEVLRTPDPRFELVEDRRWAGALYGKEPAESAHLRRGLAQTAALLGAESGRIQLDSIDSPQDWACAIVRDVLMDAPWQVWASLSEELPLLAEACSDRFLAAVERGTTDGAALSNLFTETNGGPMSTTLHMPLVTALERLLWSPIDRSRAALCLARLARLDRGGNSYPRPLNSLIALVIPFSPEPVVTPSEGLDTIDLLRERFPDIAWEVMLRASAPAQGALLVPLARPEWRQWGSAERTEATSD